ncbi:MAG: MBL fold metallo-hydrolase [Anaerolineae bacterium]|nr:MBL fold metallo-hydrolase [Anaerolineae bacterium]
MSNNDTALNLTYIGHASTLIEIDGVRLLTDPILRPRVWHLRRHSAAVDQTWHQQIDAVLISHAHWDHLDIPSLKVLDRKTRLIMPHGLAVILRKHGFQHIEEMVVGQRLDVGPITIEATYAHHNGNRIFSGTMADCLGFVIRGRQTVYFAGDTDLFSDMAHLADHLDVALLPVWGWGPTLGQGHLDPRRAAQALQLLRPRLAIPIHWGTYFPIGLKWLYPHFLTDPPHRFANFAATMTPDVEVQIVAPGNSLRVNGA